MSTPSNARLAVSTRGLRRQYGEQVIIDHLDLDIESGEFVALLGESGCGKTTLLRALARLDQIDAGTINGPTHPAKPRPLRRCAKSDCRAGKTTGHAASREVRRNGSPLRVRWCASPACFYWMNRLPPLMP